MFFDDSNAPTFEGGTIDVPGGSQDAGRGRSSGGHELHPAHRPRTWAPPGPGTQRQGRGTGASPGGEMGALAASGFSFSLKPR